MDIMMRLKGAGFSTIANAFREREKRLGGGLPLLDFVDIVLPGLPRVKTAEGKAATVSALVDLFEDIDINGDGVMEFDEFTSFCVDAGMVASRTQGATLKHRYERDTKHALKTTAVVAPVPNSAPHGATSTSTTPNPLSTWIEKLKWSADFRMFLVMENAARSVKIFTSEGKFVTEVNVTSEKQNQTNGVNTGTSTAAGNSTSNDVLLVGDGVAFVTPTSVTPPSASSVSILDAVFIHRFLRLGVSTTDFTISFYDMSESRKPTSTLNTSPTTTFELQKNLGLTTTTAQRMLRFCESSALLLGSGNDFIVNIWKIVDAETKILWRRLSVHSDLVMDALEIPVHDLLVTCDLRHTIQLWDITDGRNRGALMAHERGVRQLCYSEHHDLLLSAGFEFEALAWDLASRQVALKLSGHRAPLIGVQLALFQTERAITADCEGVFKVWDITRGHASSTNASISQAVQLESIDLGVPSVRVEPISFVSLHPYSRDLWVVTSGSCTLQRLRSVRGQQFDEVPLRAFYHSSANKFVVVAGSVCSLWDGKTGSCSEELAHVGNLAVGLKKDSSGSISAATLPPPPDSVTSPSRSSDQSIHNEAGTELLTCTHDVKCRKLIVMSEQGVLSVFNCQNFVQMRQCQDSFLSKVRVQRRKTVAGKIPVMTSASSCAVVGLHYCSENKLIIVTDAGTSAITVIDDHSNQDSSKGIGILRRLINIPGGISSSAYSFHSSIIATVGADPEGMNISLWDFETFSHLGDCRYEDQDGKFNNKDGSNLSIQTLEFWDEFPILVAGDSLGGVYFFAATPLLHAYTGKMLHAFVNDHAVEVRRTGTKESPAEDENDDAKLNETEVIESAARKLLLNSKKRKNALTTVPVIKPEPETVKSTPMETASAVTCVKVVFDEETNRKNPEIKLLEQEIHEKNDSTTNSSKTPKLREIQAKSMLTKTNVVITPRQTLRLQSLNQIGPVLHDEQSGRKAPILQSEQPAFLESGDLKMDKVYLENELSITCPTGSSPLIRPNRDGDVRLQIEKEYQLAQQAIDTRVTLTRKAREMYSNMEGVRTRHSKRRPDTIDQDVESLEVSDFLKQHFSPSVLAVRPQTAPVRVLKNSRSACHVGLRHQKEDTMLQLQISASESTFQPIESTLSNDSVSRKFSNSSFAGRRRSSLDEFYKEEFHRYRQDRELNQSVPEEMAVDGEKQLRPLHKLREINDIIDKVHGYCNDAAQSRPGTAPVGTRRSVLLTESPIEYLSELDNTHAAVLRQHLEDTKHRMQEALRDDKPHRQNLRKMRQQALQQQQKRRMHSYLQQKRRELTTNIGNVFKGLQTSHGPENEHEEAEQTPNTKAKAKDQNSAPKMLSAKKTFGMYSVSEVMSVIRLFWSMDADGSGNISMAELQQFKSVFEKLGFPNIGAVFQTIDANGDGQVSLRELLATCFHFASKQQVDAMLQLAKVGSVRAFLLGVDNATDDDEKSSLSPFAGVADKLEPKQKSELMAIFRVFDHNGDGGVSMQEIMEALRVDDDDVMAAVMTKEREKAGSRVTEPVVSSGLTREDVELIYSEFDRDKDATLDFDEFVAVMANLYSKKSSLPR
ncbi:hypothetical protein PC113_g13963 [Phytophthora cactorum]|uniref:EF-hand domain-containing protein n=1 Tax=Phytophthora cactorum TaxID=29920 RepID=A0A8T0YVL1_9STRA|nr:hypothetical protein PC113_g13963 [Phytophthora cactorum]